MNVTRRNYIRLAGATALSYSKILGANDRVSFGLIGAGGRGRGVMGSFQKNKELDVKAICDVFAERVDQAQQ